MFNSLFCEHQGTCCVRGRLKLVSRRAVYGFCVDVERRWFPYIHLAAWTTQGEIEPGDSHWCKSLAIVGRGQATHIDIQVLETIAFLMP